LKTLIIIDMQNDFCPGGTLEVKEGDQIIPVINAIQDDFELVIATQDWHPENHGSFASNHPDKQVFEKTDLDGLEQILWPDHCIQGTKGAEFHPDLEMKRMEAIFRKGMDPMIDSYSGFYDNGHRKSTGLAGYLRSRGASELYFCGLAADYCVNYSLRDALEEGFKTFLIADGTKAIDPGGFNKIQKELEARGVNSIFSSEVY